MGFLKRLLSVGGKKKRKDFQERTLKKHTAFSSSTPISEEPNLADEDVLLNRLLRSSSTHFSVISEGTEYRSMPPIPHPINNVLRAPSIISSATQTDTYTVKVHRRMLHSRTEFPDANRSGGSPSPPASPPRQALPPLTPGDKNRLARLRQDASVLSLLDIYDEQGNPNSRAFSNTPAKSEGYDPSLRALMGTPITPNPEADLAESDISWADRHIRAARRNSSSSSVTSSRSSLGIPANLFKDSYSPDCLQLQVHDSEIAFSSCEIDLNIDSLVVERGTVEDASVVLHPLSNQLTSPSKRASQYFNFLQGDRKLHEKTLPKVPNISDMNSRGDIISEPPSNSDAIPVPPPPRGPRSIQRLNPSTVEGSADQARLSRRDTDILVVREGPKQSHAQVSPPPRPRSRAAPLPQIPTQHQSQPTKRREPKPPALGRARAPFEELRNADAHDPSTRSISAALTARSVSVASSVHPQIETQGPDLATDPYTPLPPRRTADGRRGQSFAGENVPPNAPARPVRGQSRTHATRHGARPPRTKETIDLQVSASAKPLPSEKAAGNTDEHSNALLSKEPPLISMPSAVTPPATPAKNPARAYLQTPSRPSPASSSELSPQGRQIMANIRDRARKASQGKTQRLWQAWGNNGDHPR